jgi:uncharacterized glyoxalase superfamily protein PhnB
VQPYPHLRDADNMIIEAAFGAEALGVHKSPEGHVFHATLSIANSTFEIDEAYGEFQPTPGYLHVTSRTATPFTPKPCAPVPRA